MAKGVIYLEKSSLDYYAEKMPAIPKLVFPPAVIADIEVIDISKLDQMIKAFIDTNKLLPAALTIVLANSVIFAKDILKPDPKTAPKVVAKPVLPKNGEEDASPPKKEDEKELFLEAVPFNEVSSLALPIPNGEKVIAANKDFYTDIKRAFEKYGFTVEAVTPLLVFGNTVAPLDATLARRLLPKVDMARQHNMLTIHPVISAKTSSAGGKVEAKKMSPRVFIMLGIFGLLMVVLGVMVYTTFFVPAPPPKKAAEPVAVVNPSPIVSVVPTSAETVGSSSAVLTKLSIQIVEPATGSSGAADLETALTKRGVKNIVVKKGKTVVNKTIIAHGRSLDAEVKEAVDTVVQTIFPKVSSIETDSQASDVIITIGEN